MAFIVFFTPAWLLSQQEGASSIPPVLRRPERGEAPRYPIDMVIGSLGRGSAPEDAYLYARNILNQLISGVHLDTFAPEIPSYTGVEINDLRPRSFRLGGGRTEADGSISFLIRLLSQNESITGEMFLLRNDGEWYLDGLILEERRTIGEIRDSFRFDFSPYERFF